MWENGDEEAEEHLRGFEALWGHGLCRSQGAMSIS